MCNRAAKNGHEFVAEIIAKMLHGDSINSPKVLAKYRKLGGIMPQ